MKKLILLLSLTISLIVSGCSKEQDFQIEYQDLSKEESELLTLTGNRVFKYKLENLPNNKDYELKLMYEVYKNGKKIKDDLIAGMLYGPTEETLKDSTLAINIQDNKIRFVSVESGIAYSYLDIEEDISKLSYQSFSSGVKINSGDEIYLFHGSTSENGLITSDLGILSKEDKDSCINDNELNVFIRLICK